MRIMLMRSQTLRSWEKLIAVSENVILGFLVLVLFHPGLLLCLEYCPKTLFLIMIWPYERTQETSVKSMSHNLPRHRKGAEKKRRKRDREREQISSALRSCVGPAEQMVQSWDSETKKEKQKEEKKREGDQSTSFYN